MTEVIAACGYETRAAKVDEHSFTKSLTETLAVASKGSPFSVGELHSRVLRKLKCWTPSLVREHDGSYIDEPDGRLVCEHQPRRTPIYSIVSESSPRRSIVLAPLPLTAPSLEANTGLDCDSLAFSPGGPAPPRSNCGAESICGKWQRPDQDDGPCPQLLLAIHMEKVELCIDEWVEWIRNLPPEGKAVRVEGKYDSFSSPFSFRYNGKQNLEHSDGRGSSGRDNSRGKELDATIAVLSVLARFSQIPQDSMLQLLSCGLICGSAAALPCLYPESLDLLGLYKRYSSSNWQFLLISH